MKRLLPALLAFAALTALAMGDRPTTPIKPPPPPPPVVPPTLPPTPPDPPATSSAVFLSPTGNDSAACTEAAPCKTFARAFAVLKAGGELVLLDGAYASAINFEGAGAAQAPSGISNLWPTVVRAKNLGAVTVPSLFVGRSTRKDKFIKFEGFTVKGPVQLYNTDSVTLKNVGINGPFSVGTNDHAQGNEHNLLEDVWIWASGVRLVAQVYRANYTVLRRVVVRGDGCGGMACTGSGNPNVGITVYDSHDVSLQNVVVTDRVLAATDSPYADFACAQHGGTAWPFGRNEWLGVISKNGPDLGFYCEPGDSANQVGVILAPTVRVSNMRINGRGGFNLARNGVDNAIEFLTVTVTAGDGVRVAPELTTGTLKNVVVSGTGRYAFNSKYKPEATLITGTWSAQFNQSTCSVGCDSGSGAVIETRYGVDGTRHGEAGYNTLTSAPLWPWPNEARIQREMCATTDRGFCKAASFTAYHRTP